MLLWLTGQLAGYESLFGVFRYLTLRAILSVLTALAIALLAGPWVIDRLAGLQIKQSIRTLGPATHLSKAGTPTMGGVLILLSMLTSTLLWADLSNRYILLLLGVTLLFGAVGWVDDYRKVVQKNSIGLPARWKYFWQSLIGIAAALFLFQNATIAEQTQLLLPFFKNVSINLGLLFIPLVYFVIVGTSNAVNLTDGLDGLAIMSTVMVGGALGLFAYVAGDPMALPVAMGSPVSPAMPVLPTTC